MATADSKRMYSWWWDSHISPKNSKWLQENLADMDSKVKQMIKLIEEDADSFARRAEMFYKKRPELMKLVEEFYRTYRALAERYDHATGVIHQANRTMAEVFPNNQLPFVLSDESPSGLTGDADPHTPETTPPIRAFFDSDEIQKNVLGLSSHFHAVKRSGSLTEEPVFVMNRKGLKQLNDLFGYGEGIVHGKSVEVKVKKVLNFHDMEDKNQSSQKNGALSESDRVDKAETELLDLKEALAKLEAEKEASLLQRQLSMERLFNVESEVSHAQEDYQGLKDRASKAEAEVQNIKEVLTKLQADSKAGLFKYQQCLDKMSHLENKIFSTQKDAGDLNERAEKAETEVESLKQDLARNGAEKEAALIQYNQCLEMISNLECKLVQAEEEAKRISERADKAECEVELLKEEVIKLIEEKEAAAVSYQQCLETISQLEQKLASAQEKSERLNSMIEDEIAKFKGAEGRCELLLKSNQTLQSELECYVLRVGSQGEELAEKQKELNRLWTSVQEERMRFLETETAFQTLQHLHSQSQKELRSLVAELQDRAKLLNDMETHSGGLEDEVQKVKEETKSLNEINLSSALSIENLKDEISNLKETIRKLEEEVGLRVDQRNAIQQELYCLKEELNDLNKKHSIMLEQVESVGFNPENFGSSVKELQDECSELKQTCEANTGEKDLLEKLAVMEKLQDKNALLENSLADLNVELKDVRKNLLALEESYHSLLEEKSVLIAENTSLICQLQTATANMEKLAEKSKFLESSLFDANNELEGLRITSRNLENSDLLLNNEKLGLIADKENLVFQLDITQQKVEDFGNRYTELEKKLSGLEKERESALHMAEGLHVSLDAKKQEHASFAQLSETKLAYMDLQVRHLQEEVQRKKKEYEKEQDKALNAHFEILILQKFIQDLEGRSFSILIEHQKLLDASKMSHKLISELEHENIDRQAEIKSLYEQNKLQRMELYLVLKALGIDENHECPSKMEEDQKILKHVLMKLKELKDALMRNCDENDQLIIENSVILTLLGQLELEGISIMEERDKSDLEFRIQFDKFVALQGETQRLVQMNEKFRLKAIEGDERDKVLTSKLDDLQRQLLELQGAYKNLQQENHKVLGEKSSLNKKVLKLEKDKCYLEEENIVIFGEKIFQSNLSLIFKDIIVKTSLQLEELNDGYNIIHLINVDLKKKVRVLEEKLHDYQMENLHLKESMSKLGNELIMAKSVNHRLNNEMTDAKSLLSQKQNEIQLLDRQAVAVIGELLISSVCKEVLEGKILELAKSFQSLKTQNNCKDMEIELLKEKEIKFQDENVGLETQLAAHVSGVISLNDYITSLEKQTLTHTISHKFDNKESQDHQVTLQVENVQTVAVVPDGISVLQELQTRLRDIEHAVMEKERLMILENLNANAKLDCLMKEIEVLKAGNNSGKENGRTNKLIHKNEKSAEVGNEIRNNTKLKSNTYEISDSGSEVLTKDIMLDQESESSSYEISKRVTAGAEDHMLELWESTDHDSSIDLMVSNTQKVAVAPPDLFDVKAVKEHKNRYYYMESLVEKELGVDKLEISKRFASARNEGNKRKILERLDSDVQKLTNLQITVHDLKRKVEVTEKSKRGKDIEYDSVKEQLEEAEESITKLFEGNRKLMKSIEGGGSISHEGMSRVVLDESGSSIRRRRISEQARKGSEKIGCLQLEVQKLQFLLMKLDDEKGSRRRTRITEHKPSVLLKDYIYGVRVRTGKKPKRATFCGCVQLPTMGG